MGKKNIFDVIIIGAGISGVGAGNELIRRGLNDFCILEGQNVAGGRIKSMGSKEEGFLDYGAQWIHGEAPDNAIHSAISEADLVDNDVTEIDGRGDFFSQFGQKLTDDLSLNCALNIFDIMNQQINQEKFYYNRESVGNYFFSQFRRIYNHVYDLHKIMTYYAYYNWMERWERVDNACNSIDNISAMRWQDYKYCRGKRNITPRNGMMSVFAEIAKNVSELVILNSEVIRINFKEFSGTCNSDIYNKDKRPITIHCKNGLSYQCNHVIVTCSIGFLKQNVNMFCPPLPENLESAIKHHGYGNIGKIFLEFDRKWWDWKDGCIQLIWTENMPTFESPVKDSHHWTKAICGLNEVYGKKNTIVAWIGGDECAEMELLPLDEVSFQLIELLKTFTGNLNIPSPINVFRSEFSKNKFFNGGYSHPIPANDRKNIIGTLNTPVYGQYASDCMQLPYLAFAGEANSNNYYSTLHGAFENGVMQAGIYSDWRSKYGLLSTEI